jgi:hypothetical protein
MDTILPTLPNSGKTAFSVGIHLNGTWYHYCEIDADTVARLKSAESMGRFYDRSIKGHFDCRTHREPNY